MHYYDDPSATPDGEWSDGDDQAGIQRTMFTATWPNMIQRELINLVVGSGQALNAADFYQVLKAVKQLSFDTGDIKTTLRTDCGYGWLPLVGTTIGNAASGATERANADCQALYLFLWGGFDNTICPVSGGRGASALADFNAGKTLQLIDARADFLRVWDNGRGVDADRVLGSFQDEALKKHSHFTVAAASVGDANTLTGDNQLASNKDVGADRNYALGGTNTPASEGLTSEAGSADENRVRNTAINVFIHL